MFLTGRILDWAVLFLQLKSLMWFSLFVLKTLLKISYFLSNCYLLFLNLSSCKRVSVTPTLHRCPFSRNQFRKTPLFINPFVDYLIFVEIDVSVQSHYLPHFLDLVSLEQTIILNCSPRCDMSKLVFKKLSLIFL